MSVTEEYAEILRSAARLMTERAQAANTDEARRPYGDNTIPPVPKDEWGGLVNNYLGGPMGAHCAAWHPAAATTVAELLEEEADRIEDTEYRVDADWIERNYRAVLWVARAYLYGSPNRKEPTT
ncbi:hypothetical protein BDK92_7299 [Micromonospora pisi]|uniref:Uncharacterized protein n=1 Tax=Micromonospora pisi TaxID=589240 RepID=A0A495JUX1_9ACTN|nr:hypothetical protein [Micromonospora pisi]RKR92817.1 hypothetical protein BDK92_7299 [Micromonospora pisi]